MRHLWAPWRMHYILEEKKKSCIFCKKPMEGKDEKNLILFQNDYAFAIMNRFPYTNGHLMVIPKRHCIGLDQLNSEECQELFHLLKISAQVLKKCLKPHGFNIGMNIGKVSGAGEKHIHFHIVPRWNGDTSFMPVLGEAKIIPEYLQVTYQKLRSAFRKIFYDESFQKGGGHKK